MENGTINPLFTTAIEFRGTLIANVEGWRGAYRNTSYGNYPKGVMPNGTIVTWGAGADMPFSGCKWFVTDSRNGNLRFYL